jgi:hypothetical protein
MSLATLSGSDPTDWAPLSDGNCVFSADDDRLAAELDALLAAEADKENTPPIPGQTSSAVPRPSHSYTIFNDTSSKRRPLRDITRPSAGDAMQNGANLTRSLSFGVKSKPVEDSEPKRPPPMFSATKVLSAKIGFR